MENSVEQTPESLKVAYITAGGAGMFCGSCMRDNTVARAMHYQGHDVHLIPMYTPIRVDEENVSEKTLFYGGINVYMEQNVPGYRFLPGFMTRWLDQEWIIRWATSRGIETDAKQLGALTLSVLKGKEGNQRKEAIRLAKWVQHELGPHVINFSNMLISGAAPLLKEKTGRPVVVTLQGDDIFMDDLPEPYRSRCFEQVRQIVPHIDGFIVFSHFYADYMSEYFSIPREKFHIVTLGIDLADFPLEATERLDPIHREPTVGYLARMAPEKGLHVLVDAFMHLRSIDGMDNTRLKIAGWAGKQQEPYVNEQLAKLKSAGHIESCEYLGTIDRQQKLDFLSSIDVLSVPTTYRDPKGLFVLEALAAGVPVVQPEHGAFPELIRATGGGHLVPPLDPVALAEKLAEVLSDRQATHQAGIAAAEHVRTRFNSTVAAAETVEIYRMLIGS